MNSPPSPAQPCAYCFSSSCPALSSAASLLEQSQVQAPSTTLIHGQQHRQGSSGDAGTNSRGNEQRSSSRSLHSAQLDQPLAFSKCYIPTRSERGFRKFLLLSKSLLIFLVKASASLLPPSWVFLIHIRFKLHWLYS